MYVDPKLHGLKIILDDVSDAINWLAEKATGHQKAPLIHDYATGHIRTLADFVDDTFGEWVINTVVSGTIIDRSADAVFAAAARNPRLLPILGLKPFVKDLSKLAFSVGYRGNTFGEAITDRALSKYAGLHLDGWMPEAKALTCSTVAQALRGHHFA